MVYLIYLNVIIVISIISQFDIVVWNDHTKPVISLDDKEIPCPEPETFPSGL
jgi:hypothetical protein